MYIVGEIVLDEGSRDEDRKCGCDINAGFYDYDYHDEYHTQCIQKKCPIATELSPEGKKYMC